MLIFVIINPVSGDKNKNGVTNFLRQLDEQDFSLTFYYTTGKNDSKEIQKCIDDNDFDRVLVVGGDGTIRMVAEILLNTNISLGIIPMGSANGLAKDLDIPEDWKKAVKIALSDKIETIDTICINDEHLCLHLADFGLNARLVKGYQLNDRRGMLGYGLELLKTLSLSESTFEGELTLNEEDVLLKAEMVVIANSRMYGTGAVINPNGKLNDGLFEVCIVRNASMKLLLEMLLDPEKLFSMDLVKIYHTKQVTLNLNENQPFQVDGEYLGDLDHLTAKIMASSLRVLVP